jgi:hypothetical protein
MFSGCEEHHTSETDRIIKVDSTQSVTIIFGVILGEPLTTLGLVRIIHATISLFGFFYKLKIKFYILNLVNDVMCFLFHICVFTKFWKRSSSFFFLVSLSVSKLFEDVT